MNTEKSGEPVFTNIDKVLTEKIISRCKENSKESEPTSKQAVNESHTVHSSAPIKWIAVASAFVLLIIFMLSRKSGKNA